MRLQIVRFSIEIVVPVVLVLALTATPARADICPNCAGTGKMVSNFEVKRCSKCAGSGVVPSGGGVPTPNIPTSGYETNKFELKDKVERGWGPPNGMVVWADDITETDALQGLVAAGVSVVAENPGPFMQWVNLLVDREINSLTANARQQCTDAVVRELRVFAADTIKAAVTGQRSFNASRKYGGIEFKAGAVRYSGSNLLAGRVLSKTWGLTPYIAVRWRADAVAGSPPIQARPTGVRYSNFASPYYAAIPNAVLIAEANYVRRDDGTWLSENWTADMTGRRVGAVITTVWYESGRDAEGTILVSDGKVPTKLTNHGTYVFRDCPVQRPGINPAMITWWRVANGTFK